MSRFDGGSGTIPLIIGIVLVILCGTGISWVADSKLKLGESQTTISKKINTDREKLEKLTATLKSAQESWNRHHAYAVDHDQDVSQLEKLSSANAARLTELRGQRRDLTRSLEQEKEAHETYRINYRTQARADSVGEKLDTLTLPNGRTYRELIVRGFDTSGLRIHHQGGSARIRYQDLPTEWQERFQWSTEEIIITKPSPSKNDLTQASSTPTEYNASGSSDSPSANGTDTTKTTSSEPDAAEIARARDKFLQTRKAYRQASTQASIARGNAHNRNRSVPGSLETWDDRAQRMERLSQRLLALHTKAKNELSAISPADPLLQQ